MGSQYLRDAAGVVYAMIDLEQSGDQSIRTFEHGWIGRYYAKSNITVDLLADLLAQFAVSDTTLNSLKSLSLDRWVSSNFLR